MTEGEEEEDDDAMRAPGNRDGTNPPLPGDDAMESDGAPQQVSPFIIHPLSWYKSCGRSFESWVQIPPDPRVTGHHRRLRGEGLGIGD